MSQEQYKKRLKALMDRPENQVCSDCPERQPRWASLIVPPPGSPQGMLPMGAFCCLECSGSHRRLGVHVSFVRSITLDQWKESEVLAMENGGNKKVNAIYEAKLYDTSVKPNHHASGQVRERFIRDKYERRKYFDAAVLHRLVTLGEDSIDSASGDNRGQQELEDTTVRQPSEAAKLRAEHRRNRLTNHTNSSLSDTSRPTVVQIPPKVAKPIHGEPQITTAPTQPIVDLLDFSFISTPAKDMDPPPRPPSVQASPNLDLFKSLTLNDAPATSTTTTSTTTDSHDIFGDIYNRKSAASSSVPNPFPSQQEQKKTLTSNEILAMFNSSSLAQPHVHPSTSTPNLNTSSRFDFFDHIPIAKSGQPSSLTSATTTHHLHTHHSFSSTNQTVMQGTGGTLGRPPPNTPYSIHSFMQESSTFSMSHTIPNQIHGTFVPMGPTSSIPRPMNMPTAPPTYTYGGSPNTQTNHSESFPRATESVHPGYPMPMGGMTNHSSVMGGVEHGSDAFTVMGGGDNDPSSKNSNGYSNFGALNSFR